MSLKTGVHNEDQLAEFMALEQTIREPLESIQWRCYVFEDYSEDHPMMVYKCHHSVLDGLSNILLFIAMGDDPSVKDIPAIMTRFGPLQTFFQLLIVPLYVSMLNLKLLLCFENQNNGLNTAEIRSQLDNHKKIAFVHDINLGILKNAGKLLGCSLNDIIMTCTSRMFKQYLMEHTDDKTTSRLRLAVPLSLRPPPKSVEDFSLSNHFAIIPMEIELVDDVDNGLKTIQRRMNSMKFSMEPLGWYFVTKVTMQLPMSVANFLLEIFTNKMTFGFSNVPGPKNPITIAGSKCESIGFAMPVAKSIPGSIGILSIQDCVKAVITCDRA